MRELGNSKRDCWDFSLIKTFYHHFRWNNKIKENSPCEHWEELERIERIRKLTKVTVGIFPNKHLIYYHFRWNNHRWGRTTFQWSLVKCWTTGTKQNWWIQSNKIPSNSKSVSLCLIWSPWHLVQILYTFVCE